MPISWTEKLRDTAVSGKLLIAVASLAIILVGFGFRSGSPSSAYPLMISAIGKDLRKIDRDHEGDDRAIELKKSNLITQYVAQNAHFIGQQSDRDLLATYNAISDAFCGKPAENALVTLVQAIERGASTRIKRDPYTQAEYEKIARKHNDEALASLLLGGGRFLTGDLCGAMTADLGVVNNMTKEAKLRYLASNKFSPRDVRTMMSAAAFMANIMPL